MSKPIKTDYVPDEVLLIEQQENLEVQQIEDLSDYLG